ncbi:short-chain dehydrogenase [Chryseobacterium sp. FH2]|uniref:oxidoreductase n=1 Tax=Chryseobacterium sp. FH2 TaxID=1674291 RepID=UPI00065ABCD4|nr:oxidoreductase [Chryseobacterium sp. FH2]KMQ68744.1 short-chain dehydrogenase [Chryseobacterium sp. FH2]
MNKIWYVTGASKGLGLALVKKLLEKGYQVAATSRSRSALEKAVDSRYEGNFLPLEVDLTNPSSVAASIKATYDKFGKLDVVVNNAGYGIGGALEELSDNEIEQSFDVNLYGTINVIKGVLPYFRKAKAGYLMNISSMFGFYSGYGWSVYSSTKFAVTGLSEGLARDLAPLGIKVTTIAPGGFRTNFLGNSAVFPSASTIDDYDGIHKAQEEIIATLAGKQPGNPEKAAEVMITLADHPNPPVHLCLGSDSYHLAKDKIQTFETELEEWKEISFSTDFPS